MTFSYLRAIAQRKKSNYTTYIVTGILDILLLLSLVTPNQVANFSLKEEDFHGYY